VFRHLNFNLAYHQIELAPESRAITCQTHQGMFQYVKLILEQTVHLKCIRLVFRSCQGMLNFFDDTIVHGNGEETRNANTWAVLKLLPKARLTLNPDKCKVGDGGDPSCDQSIQNTTDTTRNVSWDLKIFFSKFIPHFLNISIPLHKLRRLLISVGDQISKSSFLNTKGLSCFITCPGIFQA
jgi:hypothetical protein